MSVLYPPPVSTAFHLGSGLLNYSKFSNLLLLGGPKGPRPSLRHIRTRMAGEED